MTRFKSLLFEWGEFGELSNDEKKKKVKELGEKIGSGNYIVKKPFLYRGRGWNGLIKVKDTERYEKRKTRDTANHIDYLIHHFTNNCYPDFPDRRQSRFALTHSGDADIFGDETYVIFPHKSSKIAHSPVDSYDVIVEEPRLNNRFEKGLEIFFVGKNNKKKTSLHKKYQSQISTEVRSLISDLFEVFNGSEVPLSQYGCPKEIIKKLEDEENKLSRDKTSESKIAEGLYNLAEIFRHVILQYFDALNKGYPDSKELGRGEVTYQGKYLQVHYELFEYFKENHDELL